MKRFALLAAGLLLGACAIDETIEPPAELVEFEQRATFTRTWSASIGRIWAGSDRAEGLRLGLKPTSDGEHVYVANHDGDVQAFRLADGERIWRYKTKPLRFWGKASGTRFSAGPVVANGRVVVGSLDGEILMLDAADGEPLWSRQVKGEVLAPPLLLSGIVVVRTTDGRVIALDTGTGAPRWETAREVPPLTIRGAAAPATDGRHIFVGFDNGKVAALSGDDGSMVWETAVATPGGVSELAAIVDVDGHLAQFANELYAVSYNGNAAAFAVESGEVLWRRELSSVLAPAVSWGDVFVSDVDSVVRAFDRLSGTTTWTQDALRARHVSAPAVFGELLVVGDFEGYLHFLAIGSGEMQARIRHSGEPVRARPLVVGEQIVVLSDDGELAVYRRTDTE